MKNSFSKDLFERYAAGRCTEEEQALVESWYLNELQQNPERPSEQSLLSAREEIWNGIGIQTRPVRRGVLFLKWTSVAAAVVLAALFVYKLQRQEPAAKGEATQQLVAKTVQQNRKDLQTEGTVLEASKIENSMMKLPDGSTVILEKGSKLILLPAFNKKHNREVELEGKAFFDIAHNPGKPFIIYAGTVRTTVLGTAFDVTAIPGSKTVTVNVIRGRVEVVDTKSHWMTVLPKNFQAVFDESLKSPLRRSVNAAKELAWNKQDLEFNDVAIGDAQSRFEEKFGFQIVVKDPELRKATFTYSMRSREPMESFIKSISAFIGADYSIDYHNKIISIQPLNQ